jgi:YHS domain-containing protein
MILFVFLFLLESVFSQDSQLSSEIRAKHFLLNRAGVAVDGYDPVSYFLPSNSPTKGKSEIAFTYKGIKYLFSSEENRKKFQDNPEKYEPEFGGWCAYAMGENGDKVEIDPKRFKIVNGKLNLFYNGFFGDT